MPKWTLNYETGEYEYIERDGYRVDKGDYTHNWDDSEFRREKEEDRRRSWDRLFGDDDESW